MKLKGLFRSVLGFSKTRRSFAITLNSRSRNSSLNKCNFVRWPRYIAVIQFRGNEIRGAEEKTSTATTRVPS